MRPNFEYVDKAQEESKAESEIPGQNEEMKAPDEPRAVTVKFKRKENERSAAYRKLSHAYYKDIQDKEAWIDMTMHKKEVPCVTVPSRSDSLAVPGTVAAGEPAL